MIGHSLLLHTLENFNKKSLLLPLGRVKKIMKTIDVALQEIKRKDEEEENSSNHTNSNGNNNSSTGSTDDGKTFSFMLASEVQYVMTKAAEMFIRDITTRAWKHTDMNRRKTIQKSDVIHAANDSETYDFLIDIIPRVVDNEFHNTINHATTATEHTKSSFSNTNATTTLATPDVQYGYFLMAQQQQHQPLSFSATHMAPVLLPPQVVAQSTEQYQEPLHVANNDFPSSYSAISPNETIDQNKEEQLQQTPLMVDLIFSPRSVERQQPQQQQQGDDDEPQTTPHHLDASPHPEHDELHQEQHSTNYYSTSSPRRQQQQQWTLE